MVAVRIKILLSTKSSKPTLTSAYEKDEQWHANPMIFVGAQTLTFFVAAFSAYLVYAVDFWPRWIFLAAAIGFVLYGLKLRKDADRMETGGAPKVVDSTVSDLADNS